MKASLPALRQKALLLGFFSVITLVFGIWVLVTGREHSFRTMGAMHNSAGNFFFRYITHLGDGIFILLLAALLAAAKRYFLSAGIVAGYLLSGVFAQAGKKLLQLPRPKAFFEAMGQKVYEVPGVEVHTQGSFPSGHTASVFALAVFLILALPYRSYSWLIMIAAALVGYSRVYLSQHFPVDVFAGAAIGIFSGWTVFWFLQKKMKPHPGGSR